MSERAERPDPAAPSPLAAGWTRLESCLGGDLGAVDDPGLADRVCRAVVEVLDVDGAAISVYLGGDVAIPVGASDLEATRGEALQFTVREGPCFESYTTREPVLVPDLRDGRSPAWSRWPTYAAQMIEHTPYQGVFAFPLLASTITVGSLGLYRYPGAPEERAPLHGDGGDAASVAARIAVRLLEAERAPGPDGDPQHRWLDGPTGHRRRQVWLAQGFTLQANDLTPGQALDLLRAQAYAADRLLDEVADDIVTGRLPVPDLRS
jgi:hypothetical protein